jgi:hypothetical protein
MSLIGTGFVWSPLFNRAVTGGGYEGWSPTTLRHSARPFGVRKRHLAGKPDRIGPI